MNRRGADQSSGAPGKEPAVELNIEELIIRGAALGDRRRIIQEVQVELSRLMEDQGGPPQPGVSPHTERTPSGSRKAGGESVARQIARGIYQNLAGSQ